ncbi:MAG: NAD(P)-binding domain-containing protein [Xanthobacteraceae bacterium]
MSPARKDVDLEVAIVGAGPFGLGAAAHLKAAQVDVGVFGESFSFWRDHMPRGMFIRSSWDATHLSDPQRRFTLNAYSRQCGFARPELMSLQDFLACADWFQANTVPDVDRRNVARIEQEYGGFRLTLSDGDTVKAARVVIATGLINQEFKPAPFAGIDKEYVSHAVDHADLSKFRGKRVAVVGRGQSACETAAILSDEGADVELIARGAVHWLGGPTPGPYIEPASRSLMYRLKWAPGGVGPFPISWLNELPGLERHLPRFALDWVNARACAPAPPAGSSRGSAACGSPPESKSRTFARRAAISELRSRIVSVRMTTSSSAPGIISTSPSSDSSRRRSLTRSVRLTARRNSAPVSCRAYRVCISSAPTPSRAMARQCALSRARTTPGASSRAPFLLGANRSSRNAGVCRALRALPSSPEWRRANAPQR